MLNTATSGASLADIGALFNAFRGNGDDNGNNNDIFGGGAVLVIIIIILLCGGLGNWGPNANNGNNGNGSSAADTAATLAMLPYMASMSANAGTHIVNSDYDNLVLSNKLESISDNVSNGFFGQNTAILQGFGNLNTSLCGSFDSVNTNINNLGFQLQNSLLQVSNAMDNIRYENAQNTASIIAAGTADTQRIVDHLTQTEIQDLRDRLQASEFDSNQAAQTRDIITALLPTPRPAYVVASPYQSQNMGYYSCNCGA